MNRFLRSIVLMTTAAGCASAAGGGSVSDASIDGDFTVDDSAILPVEYDAAKPASDAVAPDAPVTDAIVALECKPACSGTQVCVNGKCESLPSKCPCPKESYCDLSSGSCKVGCLDDTQCSTGRVCDAAVRTCRTGCLTDSACGTGNICDAKSRTCRAGCRSDGACGTGKICNESEVCVDGCRSDTTCGTGKICDSVTDKCVTGCRSDKTCATGQICDTGVSKPICRDGCRTTATCAMETTCDTATYTCKTGCGTDDTRCNSGRICESGACRAGCRKHEECPMEQLCSSSTKTCIAGCNYTSSMPTSSARCPTGKACVSYVDGTSKCVSNCGSYFPCAGPGYGCQYISSSSGSSASGQCRQTCTVDSDCASGLKCTLFTTYTSSPSSYKAYYCAKPCSTSCTGAIYSGSSSAVCTCDTTSGMCKYSTSTCYQTSPTYGM